MNLVFHQAALGDFVLTFPLLQALPGRTEVIAPWSKAWLAQTVCEDVRAMDIELFEFSRLHTPGGPSAVSPAVAELFSAAERVISFVSNGGDAWSANMARLTPRAKLAFCLPRPSDDWTGHVCDWHRTQLQEQGIDLPDVPAPQRPLTDGPILIHPGSGGADKCWPIDRFEHLMTALRDMDRRVLPVLGEVEVERWPKPVLEHWVREHGAALPRTLDDLYQLIDQAGSYVGNDAGPTHLAAQLGVPTVALFGPTDPQRWKPIGASVTVIAPEKPQTMSWLDVDHVLNQLISTPGP